VSRHCDPPNGGEAKGSNCEPREIIADRVSRHCDPPNGGEAKGSNCKPGEIAKDGLMFKV
jgi:hypothetical protein